MGNTTQPARRGPRPWGISRVLALLCAVAWAGACSDSGVVKTYHGPGPSVTQAFAVEGGCQLEWETAGPYFRVYVLDDLSERTKLTINHAGAGRGVLVVPGGGEYSLEVQTPDHATWTIRVVRL